LEANDGKSGGDPPREADIRRDTDDFKVDALPSGALPELRRRGRYRASYPSKTLRENLAV
jgi:hypothetical protein